MIRESGDRQGNADGQTCSIRDLGITSRIIETDVHREILDRAEITAVLSHQSLYYFLGSRCTFGDLDHKVIGRSVYRSGYHTGIGQTVLVNDNGGSAAGDISCCSTVRSSVGIGIRRITASVEVSVLLPLFDFAV